MREQGKSYALIAADELARRPDRARRTPVVRGDRALGCSPPLGARRPRQADRPGTAHRADLSPGLEHTTTATAFDRLRLRLSASTGGRSRIGDGVSQGAPPRLAFGYASAATCSSPIPRRGGLGGGVRRRLAEPSGRSVAKTSDISWGVDGAGASMNPVEGPRSHGCHITRNPLLIRPLRAVGWRIVFPLAPPVTPEVAGSSPVAPAFRSVRNATLAFA